MCSVENSIMLNAIELSQFVTQQLFHRLFVYDSELGRMVGIDDVAEWTGINASHLRDIFFSGFPMTLQDYIILSNCAELDSLDEMDYIRLNSMAKHES